MTQASEQIARQFAAAANVKNIWGDMIYNVKAYGAKGDGVTDDTGAISKALEAASANGGNVVFPTGVYVTGTNLTFPSNILISFCEGAMLSPNAGVTVTINSEINAGLSQIFTGSGTIAGDKRNAYVYPQWRGVKGDGVTDDRAAMQRAIDAIQFSKDSLYIPYMASGYKFIGGLVISNPCTIMGDQTTILRFTLASSTDIAIKIQYNFNQGYYQFPIITGNKLGIGIQVRNANVLHLECKYIDFFQTGLHLYAKDRASHNN